MSETAVAVETTSAEPIEQVETQDPADVGGTGTATATVQEGETKAAVKPKLPAGVVKELSELRADRRMLREMLRDKDKAPATVPAVEKVKPKPEDFETQEAYLDARDEWVSERAEARTLKAIEERESQKQQKSEQQQVAEKFGAATDALREKYEDFDALCEAAKDIPVTPAMTKWIFESENSGELYYHLLKNPEEAQKVASAKTWEGQFTMLAKIEARLASNEPGTAAPPPAPQPKAPKPPTPVKGKGGAVDNGELRDDLTEEEWGKRFDKKRAEHAKRG